MDKEERAVKSHQRRERFVELSSLAKTAEVRIVWEIWKNRDWESLGYESFSDYCEAPVDSGGLGTPRSTAEQIALSYQKYVEELGMDEEDFVRVGWRKLYSFRNLVDRKNIEQFISKAKSLSTKDLRLEMWNIKPEECRHDWEVYYKCKKCKKWKK